MAEEEEEEEVVVVVVETGMVDDCSLHISFLFVFLFKRIGLGFVSCVYIYTLWALGFLFVFDLFLSFLSFDFYQ
jgi:hypothetical protein